MALIFVLSRSARTGEGDGGGRRKAFEVQRAGGGGVRGVYGKLATRGENVSWLSKSCLGRLVD